MNSQEEYIPSFKLKRDEYLVEIRKNKSSDYILNKRAKLFSKAFNNEENPKMTLEQFDTSALANLCEEFKVHLRDQNVDGLVEVLEKIRCLISNDSIGDPPLNELVYSGIVPEIVNLIRPEFHHLEKLVFECSWILNNLASGDSDHTEFLVNEKIIPYSMRLLEHKNYEIADHAVWILANVTGSSLKFRDEALSQGIVNKIDTLLSNHGTIAPEYVSQIAWLMSSLCRGQGKKHYPDFSEVVQFIPAVENFVKSKQEEETYQNCMYVLFYLTNGEDNEQDEHKIQEVLNMEAMKQIVDFLNYINNQNLIIPTLKLLTNIAGSPQDSHVQQVLNYGFLDHVIPLLEHQILGVRKQTCILLSNLLYGTALQIAEVVNYENGLIIQKMINLCRKDDVNVLEECLCAFSNAMNKAQSFETNLLVQCGIIELFIDLIEMNINSFITVSCLETLRSILKDGESMRNEMDMGDQKNPFLLRFCQLSGMALLEKLQGNPNSEISGPAIDLLNEYAAYESEF